MGHCLALADPRAALGEVPVGAVVVLDGAIIGRGTISVKPQVIQPLAEVLAIREAAEVGNWRLINATLYVT